MSDKIIKLFFLILVFLILTFTVYCEEESDELPEDDVASKSAYVIPIHGDITRPMAVFVRLGIEEAKKRKVDYVIIDIDTFGGAVNSTLQIATLVGSVKPAKTIAYVTNQAESTGVSWSAGAIIAFACNEIYMAPGTSMGAAAPVYQTSEGMQMSPEKVVSAVRAQIASLAEKNGHPKNIAIAMVDKDIELTEVIEDEKIKLVNEEELKKIKEDIEKKKLDAEIGMTILKKDKILSLTAKEMEKYGVSCGTYDSIETIYEKFGIQTSSITTLEKSLTDKFIWWLSSPAIISLFIMIGMVALYMEISSPGFGIPGTVAIICFTVIFIINYTLGKAGSFEILLFLIGVIFIILELFIIPGFGITGISGIILIILSLLFSLQDFTIPHFEWQWKIMWGNLATVGLSILISFVTIGILVQFSPKLPLFKHIALNTEQKAEEGYTVQDKDQEQNLIGQKGITTTVLRPSGKAEINDNILEVETDGEYLEKDAEIEIIAVDSNRIIVRKC